jgi:hypothetical protein
MVAEAEAPRRPNLFQRLRMRSSAASDPDPVPVAAATPAPAPTPAEPPRERIDEMVALAIAEAEYTAPPVQQATAVQARPAAATPTAPPRSAASNPAISDEQEFDAVAARETIESDAERRARMQAERVVVQPTDLPDRPTGLGPNIVEYALSTTHRVGDSRHARSPFMQGRHDANCRAFRSPDLAQEWFLANGGPGRDRRALDPDGDGFACDWNPEVYRAAVQAARN